MKHARLRLASAFLFLALPTAIVFTACDDTASEPPMIDGELALRYAQENYDLGPKIFRTEGAAKSAEWIRKQAVEMPGLLESGGQVRIVGTGAVKNVEIIIPPTVRNTAQEATEDFVVVGAHHDTKRLFSVPDFAGANDGASGVGALLAMARACVERMQMHPLPCGIRFVFFDGEEALYQYTETDGLVGSNDYVAGLRRDGLQGRCRAMVLLDMIGDKDLHIDLAGNSTPALANVVMAEAQAAGYADKFSRGDTAILDDHYPFLQAGIPAVDLIDFSFGPDNRYWHTGADTMDKISAESIKTAADVALRTVWRLAGTGFTDLQK
jgi:glutaminyl-peptide cyclotransferase